MSRDKQLQEMEVGTAQSKTAVNSGAKAGDPMPKLQNDGSQDYLVHTKIWEVLLQITIVPTTIPPNLLDSQGLKQVKDVVNKGAGNLQIQ